mmetsp:Transcript_134905/g.200701  ORF Transcript_134905/g.200701 Transcript_134905/m.200701 type:complete len:338 (+) Transcript_134905:2-1015(+)
MDSSWHSRANLHIVEQIAVSVEANPEGNVHIAVKNSPFTVQLGLVCDGAFLPVDLRHFTFDVSLIYKQPGPEKEVDYVNVKPIEYKTKFNEPTGDRITFECKISALTSQHEDTLFLLKFNGTVAQSPYQYYATSEPIKVLSKTNQVKKQTKTRVTSETILHKAQECEQYQYRVKNLTTQILQKQNAQGATNTTVPVQNQGLWNSRPSSVSSPAPAVPSQSPLLNAPLQAPGLATLASGALYPDEDNFDNSFFRFMTCYKTLSNNEKMNRIEKLRSEFSAADKELLQQFLQQVQKYIREHSCMCRPCPYEPKTQDRYDLENTLGSGLDESLVSLFAPR